MGAGNHAGALGEFLAAVQGSDLGGGDHAAASMDRQVVGRLKETGLARDRERHPRGGGLDGRPDRPRGGAQRPGRRGRARARRGGDRGAAAVPRLRSGPRPPPQGGGGAGAGPPRPAPDRHRRAPADRPDRPLRGGRRGPARRSAARLRHRHGRHRERRHHRRPRRPGPARRGRGPLAPRRRLHRRADRHRAAQRASRGGDRARPLRGARPSRVAPRALRVRRRPGPGRRRAPRRLP